MHLAQNQTRTMSKSVFMPRVLMAAQ